LDASGEALAHWSKAIFGNKHFASVLSALASARTDVVTVREVALTIGVADTMVRDVFARLVAASVIQGSLRTGRGLGYQIDRHAVHKLVAALPFWHPASNDLPEPSVTEGRRSGA